LHQFYCDLKNNFERVPCTGTVLRGVRDFRQIREDPSRSVSSLVTAYSPKALSEHFCTDCWFLSAKAPQRITLSGKLDHERSRSVSAVCPRGCALVLQSRRPRGETSPDGSCLHMGTSGVGETAGPGVELRSLVALSSTKRRLTLSFDLFMNYLCPKCRKPPRLDAFPLSTTKRETRS
jgi:hypothetical protein